MFSDSVVVQSFKEIDSLVNNNFFKLSWIFRIFKFEFVARKGLNRQVTATDSTFMTDDVCGLGNFTGQHVIHIGLVCFHQYIFTNITKITYTPIPIYSIVTIKAKTLKLSINTHSNLYLL